MPERATILHADADAFYAAVEQRDDPSLRGRPVIVGGGVVLAASYEARARGVRGAMGGRQARRLCPEAVVVNPRWTAYVEASEALFQIFRDAAPVVEGVSLEEAFLDVRGLERIAGTPVEIATRLRREAKERAGLAVSVGIARTKLVAKVASRVAKPDGLLEVPAGEERAFLDPLGVEMLWGVGPKTAAKLRDRGIHTVAQLARTDEGRLAGMLGRTAARSARALALGKDARRVRHGRRRRSVGSQSAIGRGPHSAAKVDATLIGLVDRVTRRMRGSGRAGRTIVLRLRYADYTRASRSLTLARPTCATRLVLAGARTLLAAAAPAIERRGLTLVGVAVTNLDGPDQLALPDGDVLDAVVDDVRGRYGNDSLRRAVLLGRSRLTEPRLDG